MTERTAEEIMNRKVITITRGRSIMDLVEIFTNNSISGVPVVDKENTLQGIVSETDIINFVKRDNTFLPMLMYPAYNFAYLDPGLYAKSYEKNKEELLKTKVEEIMHTWVRKAKKETLESEIAAIMSENRVNRVPIVDDANKVIGIIARNDLIKSMIKNNT